MNDVLIVVLDEGAVLDKLVHERQRGHRPVQAIWRHRASEAGQVAILRDRRFGLVGKKLIDHLVTARRIGIGIITNYRRATDDGVRQVERVVGAAPFEKYLPERRLAPNKAIITFGIAQRPLKNFVLRLDPD